MQSKKTVWLTLMKDVATRNLNKKTVKDSSTPFKDSVAPLTDS